MSISAATPGALSLEDTPVKARIPQVEAILLHLPSKTPFKIATAFEPARTHIDVLIVRIHNRRDRDVSPDRASRESSLGA